MKKVRNESNLPRYEEAEIKFLLQWFQYLAAPSPSTLAQFQDYYKNLGGELRSILFSLISKAGITSIVFLIDEADDFAQEVAPLRHSFEQHWDKIGNDGVGLNFYFFFFCLSQTVKTLEEHRPTWGFVRRYLGTSASDQRVSRLANPSLSVQVVSHHLDQLAVLYSLSGIPYPNLLPSDTKMVVERLKVIQQAGELKWSAYWKELTDYMNKQRGHPAAFKF